LKYQPIRNSFKRRGNYGKLPALSILSFNGDFSHVFSLAHGKLFQIFLLAKRENQNIFAVLSRKISNLKYETVFEVGEFE
jgi:hypothetical protein